MSKEIANHEERLLNPISGMFVLVLSILLYLAATALVIYIPLISSKNGDSISGQYLPLFIAAIVYLTIGFIPFIGLKAVAPNEALVLVLFGKYYGTIKKDGFFFVNPFCVSVNPTVKSSVLEKMSTIQPSRKISLKAMTLTNDKQKVNDQDGNPIEIGVNVIWRVVNPTKAVLDIDNYITYVSTQCDAAIRQVARLYPYDVSSDGDEKSLRGSSQEVANVLKQDLQTRTTIAGLEILDARISHLAYATEIASAMLQRQQAAAIIAARQMIVEGAVGMVEMALNKLSEKDIVTLDEERKAQMVSNLLVVLCSNKDAQPVVNSGSIY